MKKISGLLFIGILMCFLLQPDIVSGQCSCTYETTGSGNWSDGSIWLGGSSPPCIIDNNVCIKHDVTSNCDSIVVSGSNCLKIDSGVSFTSVNKLKMSGTGIVRVKGTLNVESDIKMEGTSELNLQGHLNMDGCLSKSGGSNITDCGSASTSCSGNCSEFPGCVDCNEALPIQLVKWEVEQQERGVVISWTTASEKDNDYFVVETSKDGEQYSPLHRINGAGDSHEPKTYQVVDRSPAPGLHYYRLKQVDNSGASRYVGSVKTIKVKEAFDMQVYPNPAQPSLLKVEVNGIQEDGKLHITVTDVKGSQFYLSKVISAEEPHTQIKPLKNRAEEVQPGLYLLTIEVQGERFTKKVLIR